MNTLRDTTEEWLKANDWTGDTGLSLAVAQLLLRFNNEELLEEFQIVRA